MVRLILGVVIAVVLVLVMVIALQPGEFSISRSTTMGAPPAVVFAQVNRLQNWEAWSPWAEKDPGMTSAYEGPESGEGASHAWDGNSDVGAGTLTITESTAPEQIRLRLEFKRPMAATNEVLFTFEPVDEGTKVTWTMTGENGFVGKAFGLVVDMDNMVGGDFEQGLANLKAVVEAEANATTSAEAA